MEYEYKVTEFIGQATPSDVKDGKAGRKIGAQLEITLQELAREGWELQGQYRFDAVIKAGCVEALLHTLTGGIIGGKDDSYPLYQLVFRRPM